MENPSAKNEKFVKHISNGKKHLIKTKNISFSSQDNLNYIQHSNTLNNNNEILVNKIKKYNENYKSERYEPKKIKLKLPGAGHSKKVIDYIIMNPKNKRNIKITNFPEIKEENSIYSIYKENFENKKNLEELINNIANNNKNINTFRNNNSITNNSMKMISYGQKDKYKNLLLNESGYYKKKPFYVLDKNDGNDHGNVYYKKTTSKNKNDDNTSEKNSKNNTPFKHKIIKNKAIVKKKRFHLNSLNNFKTEKILVDINQRNNYNINPINLTYGNNNLNETNDNGVTMTTSNKNLYTKIGRNKYRYGYSDKKEDFETGIEEKNSNNMQQNMEKKIIEYKKGKEKYENNNNYKKEKESNNLKQLYKKIEIEKADLLKNFNTKKENIKEKKKRINKEGQRINKINHSFDRQSFKFLVHQTNKNRELSLSFSKYYKTRKDSFISTNNKVSNNDSSVSYSNINNETDINIEKELNKPFNMYYSKIMNNKKKYNLETVKKQIKLDNFQNIGRIKKNRKINDDENDDNENSENNNNEDDEKDNTNENTIKKNKTMFLAGNSKKKNINNLFIQTDLEKDSTSINDNANYINNNNNRNQFKFNSFIKKRAKIKTDNNKKFRSLKEFQDNMSFHSTRIKNKISSSISINFEILYSLENKLRIIIEKIKKYEKCPDDVNYYINYYFMNKIYKEELKIFKDRNNKEYIYNYIKMEILCLFINYYISLGEGDNFKQTEILMKTIFEIIYNNLLLFLSLAISSEFNESKNDNIIVVLNKIIKDNIDKDYLIENGLFIDNFISLDETQYIEIILQSYKSIKNYYKMIINNIYINYISKNKIDNSEKLTVNEIIDLMNDKYELEEIVPIFFVESYKSLKDIKIDFFQKFYYFYFNNNSSINNEENFHKSKSYKNMDIIVDNINYNNNDNNNNKKNDENDNDENKIDDSDNNNDIHYNKNENNEESMNAKKIKNKNATPLTLPLPSYSSKYTLILDLDETLIYSQRNISYKLKKKENINKKRIILRPGLREFLKEMKKIFELIIFSSGTVDYVNPIIEIIENDEKFFDFVLYRNHITLDEDGNNVKNLELIGRNIKKIIIIDDIPRYFKLQKDNGINIKPFLGNIASDKNTLKTLAYILKKIRNDAEVTNDIRVSLKKFKPMLYPDVISSLE